MSADGVWPVTNAQSHPPPDLYVAPLSTDAAQAKRDADEASGKKKGKKGKKKKKKAECMRIGPVFRNDPDVRELGQSYAFRACSPFMCPRTRRLLHGNVPSVNYARYAQAYGLPPVPVWAHSQTPDAIAHAAHLGRAHCDRVAMLARWAPCIAQDSVTDDDFWCAVYRMEWLEAFRAKLEMHGANQTGIPREALRDAMLQVTLLQDMNQMRLLLMDSHGAYTRKECVALVGETPYKVHYGTSLASVMHWGMLPDLASICVKLPYWDKPTETFARMSVPFDHDELANAIVRLWTKIVFQPSKMRELSKCIYEEMSRMIVRFLERERKRTTDHQLHPEKPAPPPRQSPAYRLMLILQRLVFCSLGGYYPHSTYIPSAQMRRELYRRYAFDVMSLSEFKVWVMQNKRLLTMVLRENLLFNMAMIGGLESVFDGLYSYKHIRAKTLHAMETTRRTVDTNLAGVAASMDKIVGRGPRARGVWREHFPLCCATLSNLGDVLWGFTVQYGESGLGPAVHDMLQQMFWRSTPTETPANLLRRFEVAQTGTLENAERHLRMVVLYWLIMRDRCDDQSMKKTREKYERCKARIGRDGVYLVAPFPEPKKTKRAGARRERTGAACDTIVRAEAAAGEKFLCKYVTCVEHGVSVTSCKCLAEFVLETVDMFNIYRYMQYDSWAKGEVPVGAGLEQYMWHMYDACLGWCYRPRQTSFAEEIVTSAATVCNAFTTPESLATELRKTLTDAMRLEFRDFHAAHAAFKLSRDAMHARMTEVAQAHPPDWGLSFEWLTTEFEVTCESITAMDEAYDLMMGESHHKWPYNVLLTIARTTPRDFWIIRLLYKVIYRHESIRVYPLWDDIARRQMQAIHEQADAVAQGEPLPASLGRIYYCPAHRRILAPIVGADVGKRGHPNTFAVDAEKLVVDPLTRVKYCGVRTGRIKRRCVNDGQRATNADGVPEDDLEAEELIDKLPSTFRRMFRRGLDEAESEEEEEPEESEPEPDPEDEDEQNASDHEPTTSARPASAASKKPKATRKRRTKKKNYTRCGIVPAPSVNMIGVMFMLYNALYMLCPFCGHVMRYGRDKCTEIGLWCGACVRGEKAMAARLGVSWDELNQCADPQLILGAICGVPVAKTYDAVCFYCGVLPAANRPLRYHLVYNDLVMENGTPPGLVYVGMCDHHAKWWIGRDATTMRMSTLLYNFRAQDIARQDETGDTMRRVIPRTYVSEDGGEKVMISMPFEGVLEQFRPEAIAIRAREADAQAVVKRKRELHNMVKRALKTPPKKKRCTSKTPKSK